MKHLVFCAATLFAAIMIAGCANKPSSDNKESKDSLFLEEVNDSAVYGVVGEGTSMHTLELITESGKTVTYEFNEDTLSDIQGGIFCGDHITIITESDGELPHIKKLVNITSLLGKWVSLDRNFEIKEDGTIETSQKAESQPLTHWQMCNTNLILNADTFNVLQLGPDSLSLENKTGIFVYKRLLPSKK